MTTTARVTKEYVCNAPDAIGNWHAWETVPDEHKAIIDEQGGLPCEGGLVPGGWCHGCHYFGGVRVVDDEVHSEDLLYDEEEANDV